MTIKEKGQREQEIRRKNKQIEDPCDTAYMVVVGTEHVFLNFVDFNHFKFSTLYNWPTSPMPEHFQTYTSQVSIISSGIQ